MQTGWQEYKPFHHTYVISV